MTPAERAVIAAARRIVSGENPAWLIDLRRAVYDLTVEECARTADRAFGPDGATCWRQPWPTRRLAAVLPSGKLAEVYPWDGAAKFPGVLHRACQIASGAGYPAVVEVDVVPDESTVRQVPK